jgi:hypothetical protein
MVAAIARSRMLANELRILVRKYRHDPEFSLSIFEAIKICLMSSACHPDLISWKDFIGDWLTELAFDDLSEDEGVIFEFYLHYILHIAPELWISCGRAEAAIKAFTSLSAS